MLHKLLLAYFFMKLHKIDPQATLKKIHQSKGMQSGLVPYSQQQIKHLYNSLQIFYISWNSGLKKFHQMLLISKRNG